MNRANVKVQRVNLVETRPFDIATRTLKVSWDDCCVGGQFTSKVKSVREDAGDIEAVTFENGVTLEGSLFGYRVEVV